MAHKKAGGSTRLGRDSASQRLGVKIFGGQPALAGNIIIRQRGTKWHPGDNVRQGADDTLFATVTGLVQFQKKNKRHFTGGHNIVTFVHVRPADAAPSKAPKAESKAPAKTAKTEPKAVKK